MTALFWVGGVLLVLTALPAVMFFGLHLATGEPVPSATAMPRRVQVSTSMCEPTLPVCTISRSLGSFSSSRRGKCVRSRISTSTSASRSRTASWPMPLTVLVKTFALYGSSRAAQASLRTASW